MVNLIINLILIPKYAALGACIGTICSEILITISQSIFCRKEISFKTLLKSTLYFSVCGLIMLIILVGIGFFVPNGFVDIVVKVISGAIIYAIFNIKYIKENLLGKRKLQN